MTRQTDVDWYAQFHADSKQVSEAKAPAQPIINPNLDRTPVTPDFPGPRSSYWDELTPRSRIPIAQGAKTTAKWLKRKGDDPFGGIDASCSLEVLLHFYRQTTFHVAIVAKDRDRLIVATVSQGNAQHGVRVIHVTQTKTDRIDPPWSPSCVNKG